MNTKKLIEYFGEKSKSLQIENYWKVHEGYTALEMHPIDINTKIGVEQMEEMLFKVHTFCGDKVCINGATFGLMEVLLAPELQKNRLANYVSYNNLQTGIEVSCTKLMEGNIFCLKPASYKYMVITIDNDQFQYQRWCKPFNKVYTKSIHTNCFTCLPF